jgi:aspartyl/asparaginyl beta-hydroxylase (cupin superfamily)
VGGETRYWKPGEAFVFDDTIEHEAMNPTDELRVVLIFDVWHPDLEEVEREAVAALIGARGSANGQL